MDAPLLNLLPLYEWIGQVRNNSTRYTRRKYLRRVFLTCPYQSYGKIMLVRFGISDLLDMVSNFWSKLTL